MRDLDTIIREITALKKEFTDTIATSYPLGSKVYIRNKYGWEKAQVTWTPTNSNGANPHIEVKRDRTGGSRKIDLNGIGCVDLVRKNI